MITILNGPEIPPRSSKPKQLIILLHGLGSDGNDLIGLAPELAPHFPEAHFVSPNAPFPCDMAPFGYQWFSLQDRSPKAVLKGVQTAAPIFNHFIDVKLKETGVPESALALIGFSQGTMMALYTALRRKNRCGAIIGYSGAMIGAELLKNECKSTPPVCLIHGDSDDIVPFAAMNVAETALKACDVPVETHRRPGLGHSIDQEGLVLGIRFLKQRFLSKK